MGERKQINPYGLFSNPSYITTDASKDKTDTYEKAEPVMSRYVGKNFVTNPPKIGKHKDSYFPPVSTTLKQPKDKPSTEPYVDPGRPNPKQRTEHEQKRKVICAHDFKYTSPGKKSNGSNTMYGTFQGKNYEHIPEYKVLEKGSVPERPVQQPKNITTRPALKGSYGMVGHFFSHTQLSSNVEVQRKKDQEEWNAQKKGVEGRKVFSSTCRPSIFFDEKGQTGISKVFEDSSENKPKEKPRAEKPEVKKDIRKPFLYTSPPKSGWKGALAPFPNTYVDNKDREVKNKKELLQNAKSQNSQKLVGTSWIPVSGLKTGLTRSLLRRYY